MSYEQSSMHALAFRVMRLSKPSMHIMSPLKVDLEKDLHADTAETPAFTEATHAGVPFAERIELQHPVELCGLNGLLELPQSFGTIYLGETFSSYVSVGNYSGDPVSFVGIKAELQTERQKSILYDNTSNPLPTLAPGARHDFVIKHDVKELGAHTLVCSTVYTAPDGERKYMPQYFKFASSNPLSVRTKTRQVLDSVFLEACLENATKSPLILEYVRFDPAPNMTVEHIDMRDCLKKDAGKSGPLGEYISGLQIIGPSGGSLNFLYHVKRAQRTGSRFSKEVGNSLGKLEIKWRNAMGEVGRLQTQQIMGMPDARKEVELQVSNVPDDLKLGVPFDISLTVRNNVDRRLGPLVVGVAPAAGAEGKTGLHTAAVVVQGQDSIPVGELQPYGHHMLTMRLVALKPGVQRVTGIQLYDAREVKVYDNLHSVEVFVE